MTADPGERTHLAAQDPARVAAMKLKLQAWGKQQRKPLWLSLAEAPIAIDKTLKQPQAADDAYIYWAN